MQTLRSQMNPHFMFNTLNSINSFIIQNKSKDASKYLTMFSKLMRNILENSKYWSYERLTSNLFLTSKFPWKPEIMAGRLRSNLKRHPWCPKWQPKNWNTFIRGHFPNRILVLICFQVLRERPPPLPPRTAAKVVEKLLPPLPQAARRVVVERFGPCPPKPTDVVIERWLPYKQSGQRRILLERAAAPCMYVSPFKCIIYWHSMYSDHNRNRIY